MAELYATAVVAAIEFRDLSQSAHFGGESLPGANAVVSDFPWLLVMEQGTRSLDEALRAEGLAGNDASQVVLIMRHVAEAVESLHRVGWLHGDIKPRNIVRVGEVRADAESASSFKALCSTSFPASGAQLWMCDGSECSADNVQRRASDSPN